MKKREKLAREREQKDWIAIVQQMLNRAIAEHQRWYDAGVGSRSSNPYKARMELTIALALVQAGVNDIESAILDTFQQNGEHRSETIARRLLKLQSRSNVPYNFTDFVERELSKLVAQKKVTTRYGRGNYKLYLLVTPERLAEWKEQKAARAAAAVESAKQEQRKENVVTKLLALGLNDVSFNSYSDEIRIGVPDVEKLIVLVGKGLLSFAEPEGQAKAS